MKHPTQGNTQMFRHGLDDAGFQQVLVLLLLYSLPYCRLTM